MSMVQYGLWPNCTNKCDFCLLKDRDYKTKDERLRMLNATKENIKIIDWVDKFSDGISLLGGEVFYTEYEEIKVEFLDLINIIIDNIFSKSEQAKLSIVTNGIYDPNVLLIPTLDILKNRGCLNRFDLNFSYDIKYRFHSEKSRKMAIDNINMVYNKYGIVPNVQTCLTEYLIDAHLNKNFDIFKLQKELFPNSYLSFLYPHKINTGKKLDDFFFKRSSLMKFVQWLKSNGHNDSLQQFLQSVINSSQFKYSGLFIRDDILEGSDDKKEETQQQPTLEKKQELTECGHSILYRCYSDSDKCMLCDLLKVL